MLINDIAFVKKHLGGVQKTMKWETWEPFVAGAEHSYIIPAIGWELYDQLTTLTAPSPKQKQLIEMLQRALAFFAYVDGFAQLVLSVGDIGISVATPANTQAMGKWMYVAATKDAAAKADRYLEGALQYLEKFESEFPTWQISEAYTQNRGRMIASATEATVYFPALQGSRRLYLNIRGYYHQAEEEFIQPVVGEALYEALMGKLKTPGSSLTTEERKVLSLCRKMVVQFGFAQAVPYLNLNVDFRLVSETDGILNEDALGTTRLNAIMVQSMNVANDKAAELKRYMNEVASATILPEYFSSGLYTDPNERKNRRPKNDPRNPHFALY